MVEPIAEGDKVKAEIVNILYKEQLKYIKDEGMWWVNILGFLWKNTSYKWKHIQDVRYL